MFEELSSRRGTQLQPDKAIGSEYGAGLKLRADGANDVENPAAADSIRSPTTDPIGSQRKPMDFETKYWPR